MRVNAKEIADRISRLRRERDVSAPDMAAYVQVSPELYADYESAALDIPASVLAGVASRLDIEVGMLMTGMTPAASSFAVTRKGGGPEVDRREGYKYENLAATFKEAKIEPFLVTLPVTSPDAPIPQNTHPGQEFHYLLEGAVHVKVQEDTVRLDEGDSLIFDANKPHGIKALDNEAKLLAVLII